MLDDRGVHGRLRQEPSPTAGEIPYFVLVDRAVPYLLARVRWPDVAQAISAPNPDWLDDPGLYDLPYDPSAVRVSFAQAASVAAGWGIQLDAEPAEGVPSYLRRMPANWSDLSPSERRAWGIELVGTRRSPARPVRRSAVVPSELNGRDPERRRDLRMQLEGRAHIRSDDATLSAGLVDLCTGGAGCVVPAASPLLASDVTFAAPFLLEAGLGAARICLDVTSRISWYRSDAAGTHFGVAFAELTDDETEGVQRFLAATRKQSRR